MSIPYAVTLWALCGAAVFLLIGYTTARDGDDDPVGDVWRAMRPELPEHDMVVKAGFAIGICLIAWPVVLLIMIIDQETGE